MEIYRQQALPGSAAAIARKGSARCPFHVRIEINAAKFDLRLILELADAIARDA